MGTIVLSELIKALMNVLGITTPELARALHTPNGTVLRWLADDSYPERETRDNLDALELLAIRLLESFGSPEAAQGWLRSESGYFGGARPLDALLGGQIRAVYAALEAMDSGVFV